MRIELKKLFSATTQVDEFDVRQMKKALNRLGYYQPYDKVGITEIPDTAVFDAVKSFQRDQGISVTGEVRPNDETLKKINSEIARVPSGKYGNAV
jgi:peptidoglycan hydrolase-like protein with peptidoglycan-binding domain